MMNNDVAFQQRGGVRFVDRRVVTAGEKVQNSLCGAVFGIVLFLVAFPLLFWNEGRAVATHNLLVEGKNLVISIDSNVVNREFEGRLVHLTGPLKKELLKDEELGVSVNSIILERQVEMYQWAEHKDTKRYRDPNTNQEIEETQTSYREEWSSSRIDSGSFRDSQNYHNPKSWPMQATTFATKPIVAGAFALNSELGAKLSANEPLYLSEDKIKNCHSPISGQCIPRGEFLYFRSGQPAVGDIRVKFRYFAGSELSVIGQQKGETLTMWKSQKNGSKLGLVSVGEVSSDEMFDDEISSNTLITWAVRAGGFLMMFFGLQLAIDPIFSIISYVPLIGGLVSGILRFGTSLALLLLCFALTTIVVAIGWFWARPIMSITLIAIAVAAIFFAKTQKIPILQKET